MDGKSLAPSPALHTSNTGPSTHIHRDGHGQSGPGALPSSLPAPTGASSSAPTQTQTGGRPRNQGGGGRKKAALPIEPDSLYRGAGPGAGASSGGATAAAHGQVAGGGGVKRGVEGGGGSEPRKRKRVAVAVGGGIESPAVHTQHMSMSSTTTQTYSRQAQSHHVHAQSHAHGHGHSYAHSHHGSSIVGTNVPNSGANIGSNGIGFGFNAGLGVAQAPDGDGHGSSFFEFSTLPTSALYEYITQYDLVPMIYPTPLTAEDPPPPISLLDPARMASRAPTPTPPSVTMLMHTGMTPANRPRRSREAKDRSRRRSTRLLEEELRGGGSGGGMEQVPVLADVGAVHSVLATIAGRHFRETSVREMDTLSSFLGAVKARR